MNTRRITLGLLPVLFIATQVGFAAGENTSKQGGGNTYTITEKPTAYQEADRLGIWYPASDFEPLGLHLAPGQTIDVSVKNTSGNNQPKLLVGTYSRYKAGDVPTVYDLAAGSNSISDSKGGLLYLQYVTKDIPSGKAEVTVSGGNPIPSYVLGKSTHQQWLQQLDSMTYEDVQFISNRTMIVVSKATALKYKDQNQERMLEVIDRVCEIEDYISGIDGSSDLHKPNVHKILITELTQKKLDFSLAALEHRIIVPTAACRNIMDPAFTSTEAWGLWHEMGHHRQALNWDWNEVDEVTVNIYSLACLYKLDGTITWLKGHKIWDVLDQYFQSPIDKRDFNKDKTLGGKGRLTMFRQLWMAFGDRFYIKLHQLAREDNAKPNPRVKPRDENVERQMANFMLLASEASGFNLKTFFKEWGFRLPQEDFDALDALDLPDPKIDLLLLME